MGVSNLIRKQLIDRARDFNIILDDVSITELSFGKEYSAAVEAKQIAQQEAQRAAHMLGAAISQNPGYLKLRKLAASKKISATIAQSQNRVYLSANSLLLDVASPSFDAGITSTA